MKISVITAARDAERTITTCLVGLKGQFTRSRSGVAFQLEHILVDGASRDLTVDLARRVEPSSLVLSERDHGIYDAMNKGIRLVSGDVVGILNADDFYFRRESLAGVADAFSHTGTDACYGNVVYIRRNDWHRVARIWKCKASGVCHLPTGWMPPHPTFFVRRECYESYGLYREDFGTAADYELIVRFLVKERLRAVYVPDLWVAMRVGGASNASLRGRLRANRMDRRAWTVNGVRPSPFFRLLKPARKLPQYARIGRRSLERELRNFLEECGKTEPEAT